MSNTEEAFHFQVKDIRFQKDAFNIVMTAGGEIAKGNFDAKLGHFYKAFGNWEEHASYGRQYVIQSAVTIQPTSPEDLAKFLAIQMKGKGVGESVLGQLATACVEDGLDFGELLDKNQGDKLKAMLAPRNHNRVDILLEAWPKLKPKADLVSPLLGYGLSAAMAESVVSIYGVKALEKVESEPYELILEIDGMGFILADRIATKVGRIAKNDEIRLRAALSFGLREATQNGDCGVIRSSLIKKTMPLVNESVLENGKRKLAPGVELLVTQARLEEVINLMITPPPGKECGFADQLIEAADEKGNVVVWYRPLIEAEQKIAHCIANFNAPARPDLVAQIALRSFESGMTLAPEQKLAVERALTHPVTVITGGPGVGKSATLKVLLATLIKAKLAVTQAAPTGKAAKRITLSTGYHARTQHSTVGFNGAGPEHHEHNPLETDVLVLDEQSMGDTVLTASTLAAVRRGTRVVLVGDVDQLPSVGPGQVFRDLIRSGVIPVTRLTKVFRQGPGSGIVRAATLINQGQISETTDDMQFEFVETEKPAEELFKAIPRVLKEMGLTPDDLQCLSPSHKGDAGVLSLNIGVQKMLNPNVGKGQNKLRREKYDIWVGDRVIQNKNDRNLDLVNGDIGWIDSIATSTGNTEFSLPDKDASVKMDGKSTQHLSLAYAITIHKSQGAEAPIVLIALDPAASFMLRRSLVYTGITRGAKKVILFSSRSTYMTAVRRGEPPEGSRRTALVPKLLAAFEGRMPVPEKKETVAEAMMLETGMEDVDF